LWGVQGVLRSSLKFPIFPSEMPLERGCNGRKSWTLWFLVRSFIRTGHATGAMMDSRVSRQDLRQDKDVTGAKVELHGFLLGTSSKWDRH
jgi:hypothetical protein